LNDALPPDDTAMNETPNAPADEALDAVVLSVADAEWRKVARFIAIVVDAVKAQGLETSGQDVAQRIYALVEAGRLEARGNIRRWRAGEVRGVQTAST
jgi:hypothetical protein